MDLIDIDPVFFYGGIGFLLFVSAMIGLYVLARRLRRPEMLGMSRADIAKKWMEIRKTSDMSMMGAKMGVLEADNLLDATFKSLMMPGETMGERLKAACYRYPGLERVWWAHKLRNQIAHDASANISQSQAKMALHDFERALKILNVM